ncbi:MAG: hypothetical protein KME09_02550 [Pleurocapsa minor HA4230-MV1]|jgi:hypothetical protein|nr:hypothetical protein [Pleurocapsa minor HA4230-MV1]
MKQNIRLFSTPSFLWSKLLDSNPQLFREIQGKLKTRNVVMAAAIAVIAQFMAVVFLLGQLPDLKLEWTQCGRYGMAIVYQEYSNQVCYAQNEAGNWVINWQLWWLDLFIILSITSIFALLVVGTYLLIADTVQEESRGTLNFIRLTPQSAGSVLLGKILGVPILVYTAIALLLPLHLVAGLQSHIPLTLILAFDLTVVASCAFFYCLGLLWSLLDFGLSGFKPWFASGLLGFLLMFSTAILFGEDVRLDHFLAWTLMFHPGIVLTYLIDASHLRFGTINFLSTDNLAELSFYGQALWTKTAVGIGLILANFSLWTYWCWAVLKRRFHNPEKTILSKVHSYWLTAWFALISLGFTLQTEASNLTGDLSDDTYLISNNFIFLQVCLSLFGLGLIFALSPHRQTLYDWARYRHQNQGNSLWKELVLGENSPSTIAMAINLAIAITFISPSIFLLLPQSHQYVFWGLVLSATNILLYAVIAQFLLTIKTRKRAVWSIVTVVSMIILPPVCLGIAQLTITTIPQVWLLSFVPLAATKYVSFGGITLAILGQWLAISVIGLQMTRKLKQAGASSTKILMSRVNALSD